MFRNYVKVTLRTLRKSGSYAFINVSGLSIGITCTLLIFLWVFDELSFDRFLPKSDRLHQIFANVTYDGKINTWNAAPVAAVDALKGASPHIVNACATDWGNNHLLTVGEHIIRKKGYFVTSQFLNMFQFPLTAGEVNHALEDPSSIVLSAATARALFGTEDPINKLVRLDNRQEQKVTAVLQDIPANSTFQFDFLLPWSLNEQLSERVRLARTDWEAYGYGVYCELDDPSSFVDAESAIRGLPTRHGSTDLKHEFFMYPMTQWRLFTDFENGKASSGGIVYVRLFGIIGGFILLIACINFMNLATARSEKRAKEVGIRKIVGSSRRELVFRFLGESVLTTLVAFSISLLLAELLLPSYNTLVHKELHIPYGQWTFWWWSLALTGFTGVVSGSYPALYLSSFRPVKVLKGIGIDHRRGVSPRQVLVMLQFGFSILLIIGTIVVYRQIQYVKTRDMGFDREGLLTIKPTGELFRHFGALKHDLLASGVVKSVTQSNSAITDQNSWTFIDWPGKPAEQKILFANLATEYDYTKTMGIKLLMGRDFSEEHKGDSTAVMVNKAALDLMELKDPIGQELIIDGKKLELVGVMENTVMRSPNETVGPMVIQFFPIWFNAITIRLEKTSDLPATLAQLEGIFKKNNPAYPFEYKFVDVEFEKKFKDITLAGTLANLFTALAIIITGLGLFGLASYTAEQRTREMGIRKVMGASIQRLVLLMTRDFSRLVLLAFLISAPLSWWMMNNFLSRYTYRTSIPLWVFPLAGIVAFSFAVLIVSIHALRAARANPVNSLRSE